MFSLSVRVPLLASVLLASCPFFAQAEDWNAVSGDWDDPLNWSPNLVPTPGSGAANVLNGGTATVDMAVPNVDSLQVGGASTLNVIAGGALTVLSGSDVNGGGTIGVSGGTLTFANYFNVGSGGTVGLVNQTGGVVNVNGQWMAIGLGGGATGSAYNLSGGTLNTTAVGVEVGADRAGNFALSGAGVWNAGSVEVGLRNGGNGLLTISNGTLNTTFLRTGRDAGATGEVRLSGGSLNITGDLYVGSAGNGIFKQTGGSMNLNGNHLQVGDSGTSTGLYDITGGSVSNVGWLHIGNGAGSSGTMNVNYAVPTSVYQTTDFYLGNNGGTGVVNVTSGKLEIINLGEVGRGGGTGTLNISGADADVVAASNGGDPFFKVGTAGGNGMVNISAGGSLNTTNTWFASGEGNGSLGTSKVTGVGSTLNSRGMIIGWSGTGKGTLTIENGALATNVGREVSIGRDPGSEGTVNVTSNGVFNAGPDLRVGHNSKGTLNIDGGTVNAQAGWAIVGDGGNANGRLNLINGNFNSSDSVFIGVNGGAVGVFDQTGGAAQLNSELNIGRGGSTGTLNVDGGTFNVNGWTTFGRDGNGTGTLNVRGSGVFTHLQHGGDFLLGWNNGSHGYVNIESGGQMTQNWWLRVGVDPGSNGELKVDGAGSKYMQDQGRVYIGERGNGKLTVSNGGSFVVTNADMFTVGGNDGSANGDGKGIVNVSGTGSVLATNNMLRFGAGNTGADPGRGTLNLSGGSVSAGGWIGFGHDGGDGILNQSGGSIVAGNEFYIGIDDNGHSRQTTGLATITGGTITTNNGGGGGIFLGRSGGKGIMNLNGTNPITITSAFEFNMGRGGVGSGGGLSEGILNIVNPNATVTSNNSMHVGRDGGKGTINQAAGNISVAALYMANGNNSQGTINITAGTFNNHGWTEIGTGAGSVGLLKVDGPTAVYKHLEFSGDAQVGYNGGSGRIDILNGGQMTQNWWLNLARGGGSTGLVNVDGPGSTLTMQAGGDAHLNVGEDGTGTLNVTNEGLVDFQSTDFAIATNGGSTGTLNLNTGGQIKTGFIRVGGGNATINFDDGILIARQNEGDFLRGFTAANSEILGGGLTFNSNGFNITASTNFDGNGGITKTGNGVLTLSGTMTYQGVTTVEAGSILANAYTGAGGITKDGPGLMTLTGVSDNTGTTTVDAGTLALGANNRLNTTTPLVVNGGAFYTNTFSQTTGQVTLAGGSLTGIQTAAGIGTITGASYDMQNGLANAVLAGPNALTKTTPDTVTLRGSNTFSGGSTINAGTLAIGHDNAFGTGAVVVNGGKLSFDNSGLYEGRVAAGTNSFDQTTPVPHGAVTFDTPRGNSTDTGAFGDNSTWGYLGNIVVPGNSNVTWTFAEQFDDSVKLAIDANAGVINNSGWNEVTKGTVTLTPGKHAFEVRFGQGGGGVGPNSGWNIGFGVDLLGRDDTDPAHFVNLGDASFVNNLQHDISVPNAITLNPLTTEVYAPYQYATNTLTGIVSGAGGLTKTGPGTVVLTGANTYSGGSVVSAGRLVLTNNVTGSSNFVTNAELEFNTVAGVRQLSGGSITGTGNLIKTGTDQLWLGANGAPQTVALTGANSIIDVQAGVLRNEYGNTGLNGNLAGLKVATGGIFDLWDGNAAVDEMNGTGIINKGWSTDQTLTIGVNNGSGAFSGPIYNNRTDLGYGGNAGGNLTLTKTGTGTQTLTGNSTYAGGTNVNAGTIIAGGRGLGAGTLNIGASGTVTVNQTTNTGLASLYFNSAPVDNGGFDAVHNNLYSLRGRVGSLNPFTVVTTPVMNLNNGGATIPAGVGPDYYQAYYSGMVNITTGGTYDFSTGSDDGSMVWVDGQLVVSNNHYQGFSYPQVSGNINLTPGRHSVVVSFYEGGGGDSLRVGIAGPDTLDFDVDLGTSGPQVTPDLVVGSLSGSGSLQLTTGGLIVGTDNSTQSSSSVISGIGGVLKVGSGTQTLLGANTYSGSTTLGAGKLILGGAAGTAAGTGDLTITPNSGWPSNGVELASNQTLGVVHFLGSDWSGLRPEGNMVTVAGLDSPSGKGVIENNAFNQAAPGGNGTVVVNTAPSTSHLYDGYFRDFDNVGGTTLSLVKNGTGTQILRGNTISYTGTTTINGGTLQLGTGSQLGTLGGQGPIIINNGGTLLGAAVDATGYYNQTGANSITINQGGTLSVTANNRLSMDRDLNVVGGVVTSVQNVNFDNGASYSFRDSGNGPINHYNFTSAADGTSSVLSAKDAGLQGNATFNVADGPGAVDMNVTGNFVDNFGTGSFTKTNAGVVRFSGNNTYTGATNLIGGTLLMGASNTLPDTAALNLSSGTTLNTGGFSDTTGTLAVNGAAILDLTVGSGSQLTFGNVAAWTGLLSIWNYSGGPWTLGSDKLLFTAGTANINLANVQFYSDNGINQIGSGGGGLIGNELVPVPEPGAVLATGLLGLLIFRRETRHRSRRAMR